MSREIKAVIDVGSNTVRICAYALDCGRLTKKIFDAKQTVGLAAYVEDGVMTTAGIQAAAKAITRQLAYARLLKCDKIAVFATAALRNCANTKEAVKAIEEKTDFKIDLLSAYREAELGFEGTRYSIGFNEGLVIDIGGGSTELSIVRNGKLKKTVSIPQGSLSSWKNHVAAVLPTQMELEAIKADFKAALNAADIDISKATRACGVGGTIRTAAKLHSAMFKDGSKPELIACPEIDELLAKAEADPDGFAHTMASVRAERIHTILCGLGILDVILHETQVEEIKLSKCGLREGYVLKEM